MNPMRNLLRKIFSPSTVTTILSVSIMLGVIGCVIASAPKPVVESEPETELTRVEAPEFEIDTYARPALTDDPVTIAPPEFASPETTSPPAAAPETTVPVTTAETAPVTAPVTTSVPETTSAPEMTSVPETTAAPETKAPETQAPKTSAPETTAPKSPSKSSELLADKYKVEYSIVKPEFSVSEHELKLAAAVIQLEVMGGGSSVDAFEDKSEKYTEMLLVAEVIRNRVDSEKFPDSVEEVINQTIGGVAQFSPVERLEKTLENGLVTEGALSAAREALVDGVMVKPANYCYFCATYRVEYFERTNSAALYKDANGNFDKWEGHLTTFYAGNINND